MKPFDLNDPRNIFPVSGKIIDDAMKAKKFNNTSLATALGVDHTVVAGYRRGHGRPGNAARVKKLETLLGVRLDMSEPTPGELRRAGIIDCRAAQPQAVDHTPALKALAAVARELGFKATFSPLAA